MDLIPPSMISEVCFLGIVLAILLLTITGVYFANRRDTDPALPLALKVAVGLTLLLAADSAAVASGWLASQPFPHLPIFLFLNLFAAVVFALSPLGSTLAGAIPLFWLIAFQAFRLPLELVLHNWADSGTIPASMSWNGSNFDVISGVLALLLAPLASHFRPAAWLFNVVGSLLLANVIRVAIMSSSLPFAWGLSPPLLLAFYLPFAWIIPVCVGGALAGHIILTRALLLNRGQTPKRV